MAKPEQARPQPTVEPRQPLSPAHAEVIDAMAPPGQCYTPDAGYSRPGSWEWATPTARAQRGLLEALGYEPECDSRCPWRRTWSRPASVQLDVCSGCRGRGETAGGCCDRCEGAQVVLVPTTEVDVVGADTEACGCPYPEWGAGSDRSTMCNCEHCGFPLEEHNTAALIEGLMDVAARVEGLEEERTHG